MASLQASRRPKRSNKLLPMPVGQYIPFGLRPDGEIIDPISAKRGLACDCVCPGCRKPLVAKQGAIRVHHFSHAADSNCSNGQMTALLMAAKQVLQREKRTVVPALVVTVEREVRPALKKSKTLHAEQPPWHFEAVHLERAIAGHRADVHGTFADGSVGLVDFKVSRGVAGEKATAYREANLAALEIDLSKLLGESLSMVELTVRICDTALNKRWVHHPDHAALERRALEILLAEWPPLPTRPAVPARPQTYVYNPRRDDLRGLDAHRLAVRREHERFRALPIGEKWGEVYKGLGFGPERWPSLLDIPVDATPPAIDAPRRLWQGAAFQHFILGALSKGWEDRSFSAASWNAWCDARFGVAAGGNMAGLHKEVAGFLAHLERRGFIRATGDRYLVAKDGLSVDD